MSEEACPSWHAWVRANWRSSFKRDLPGFCSGACPVPLYGVFALPDCDKKYIE